MRSVPSQALRTILDAQLIDSMMFRTDSGNRDWDRAGADTTFMMLSPDREGGQYCHHVKRIVIDDPRYEGQGGMEMSAGKTQGKVILTPGAVLKFDLLT